MTDTTTDLVPRAAISAADTAILRSRTPQWTMADCVREALDAAAPHIIAAELERLADHHRLDPFAPEGAESWLRARAAKLRGE